MLFSAPIIRSCWLGSASAPIRLLFLTTTHCPLCVHFKEQLDSYIRSRRAADRRPVLVETVDIQRNRQYYEEQLDSYIRSRRAADRRPVLVEIVDIQRNRQYYEEYKYDVPVVLFNDRLILKHRFRSADFEKALDALQQ
ncbi:unnamed protein product [Gongylonema pulchrum]|uniref:Glutaredoxin-like protein n=1 Tax=Gongylonema pulchrum TaxID=637853 RepID=A0A183ER57_9BILA|nr:unnamed protein product [Gongylonema pulchrum]